MSALRPNSDFLVELLRDFAFFFLFLALVAGWLFLSRIPGWIRSIRSASWPSAAGEVETVAVKAFASQSLGEVAYSYSVEGVRYSGRFSRQFADEQDAWSYVTPLKGQPIVVRYKPGNPDTSALRLVEQTALFMAQPMNFLRRLLSVTAEHFTS